MAADLGALRMLVAVANSGSLSAASRQLGTSQQAVSSRMRTLESELGLTLLLRSPQGSRLTEVGTVIAGWAHDVVAAAEQFDASVRALSATSTAPLRVAASLTIAEHLLPGWLLRLHASTQLEVELTAANSAGVIEQLRAGNCELGFIETPQPPSDLRSLTIAQDELVVVVRPAHPWTQRPSISAAELAATPLVVREEGSGTRAALARALAEHPDALHAASPAAVLPTTAAVRATVAGSDSPAVLSILAVADSLRAGTLKRVTVSDLRVTRPLSAIWRSGALPSTDAQRLLAVIAEAGRESAAVGTAMVGTAAVPS